MPRRGEIYYGDWACGWGPVRAGSRPSLIVQDDLGNQFNSTAIVVAMTAEPRRDYPFHVRVSPAESGLPSDSTVPCEHIQTVDRSHLTRLAGALRPDKMLEVDLALHRSPGLRH